MLSLDGAEAARDRRLTGAAALLPVAGRRSGSRRAATRRSSACSRSTRTRPNEFRCNQIVRNIDEFYDGVRRDSESDALWLDPDQRVTIW